MFSFSELLGLLSYPADCSMNVVTLAIWLDISRLRRRCRVRYGRIFHLNMEPRPALRR